MGFVSDEQLVEQIRSGDESAYEQLYDRYKGLARKKTHEYYLIGADKDDVLQESMIGLFKAVRDYDAAYGQPFSAFASLCISRHVANCIRNANSPRHLPLNSYVSLFLQVEDSESSSLRLLDVIEDEGLSPEEKTVQTERAESLNAMLKNTLSSLEREVLTLFLQGMQYKDIAACVGRSTKAVDNSLQRIRAKIVKYLSVD